MEGAQPLASRPAEAGWPASRQPRGTPSAGCGEPPAAPTMWFQSNCPKYCYNTDHVPPAHLQLISSQATEWIGSTRRGQARRPRGREPPGPVGRGGPSSLCGPTRSGGSAGRHQPPRDGAPRPQRPPGPAARAGSAEAARPRGQGVPSSLRPDSPVALGLRSSGVFAAGMTPPRPSATPASRQTSRDPSGPRGRRSPCARQGD